MEDKQKTLSDYRLQKAKEDLEAAKITFDHHKLAQSVNRSYYAFFHAVRALLAYDLFDSKRHSSVIGYFNQQYVATGKIGMHNILPAWPGLLPERSELLVTWILSIEKPSLQLLQNWIRLQTAGRNVTIGSVAIPPGLCTAY